MALALTEAARHDRSNVINTMLLDSIYFTQIQERRSNVREAHHSTFEWVFRPSSDIEGSWTNLVRWLQSTNGGENVYWITGKAGSGKSTLMRYVYEAKQTKEHLKTWAGDDKKLLTACCFFWSPGNAIQKSLNGLLRTLLHEFLMESPDCIKLIAPWRWRSLELGSKLLEPWKDGELLKALDAFFQHTVADSRICLFVDGLDEFHGTDETREDLIFLLQELARNDNAKICLSSRPWNIFNDAFGSGPMLRLEDLTRGDIQRYVNTKLTQHCRFQALKRDYEAQCLSLIDSIVEKASGVFLWVYLVVRSLTQGLRDEDGLADLRRRLDLIPADLELYFDQMLSTIDPFYLPRSSQLFQLTLCTDRRLSQLTLSFIHEDNPGTLIKLLQKDTAATVRDTHNSTSRRVNALSKGFLEINRTDSTSPYFSYVVDFLHRTVRDFLVMDKVRQKVEGYSGGPIPCHFQLCTAVLAQIQSLGPNYGSASKTEPFLRLLDEFLFYAQVMETNGSMLPEKVFNELVQQMDLFGHNNVLNKSYQSTQDIQALNLKFNLEMFTSEHWADGAMKDKDNNISFFISAGLFHPVMRLIETNTNAICGKEGRPLLDYALRRDRHVVAKIKEPNVRAARLVLEGGAHPNQMYGECTIWHGFLSWMRNNKKHIKTSPDLWIEATELMIEHAAEEFPTVGVFFREIFDADTAKRLKKMLSERDCEPEDQPPPVDSAQDVLPEIQQKRTTGWISWMAEKWNGAAR